MRFKCISYTPYVVYANYLYAAECMILIAYVDYPHDDGTRINSN